MEALCVSELSILFLPVPSAPVLKYYHRCIMIWIMFHRICRGLNEDESALAFLYSTIFQRSGVPLSRTLMPCVGTFLGMPISTPCSEWMGLRCPAHFTVLFVLLTTVARVIVIGPSQKWSPVWTLTSWSSITKRVPMFKDQRWWVSRNQIRNSLSSTQAFS